MAFPSDLSDFPVQMETGIVTLTSLISPYEKDRQMVRSRMPPGDFIEVHMDVSLPCFPPAFESLFLLLFEPTVLPFL